ncbi:MAG: glycosyltransferase family 2 protein [Bacteroidales bacterium]|nr:glycosyltransferase family 2 protein [Bacteroidales bacterium]
MPDISIIIPVYNVEDYVAECIRSVINQETDCSIECLIVDDRGTDRSMDVVRETLQNYSGPIEFRIITQPKNGGLSSARNAGIRNASGKYVYFLDSDDLITPDCIAALHQRAAEHPSAEIIVGDFETFPEKGVWEFLSLRSHDFPDFSDDVNWIRSIFLRTFPVIACNRFIKRDFIERNNLYFREGILHEDNHWMASAYHSITSVAFVKRTTYLYRMRSGSITQNPHTILRKIENLGIIGEEMFAKQVVWDGPWTKWVMRSMDFIRTDSECGPYKAHAQEIWRKLGKIVLANPSTPPVVKLLLRYYRLPKHPLQNKIFYSLLVRYCKFL